MPKILTIIITVSLFCYGTVIAQKITADRVPAKVGASFRTKFPAAQQDSWSMVKQDVYEAQFYNEKKVQSAQFDESGKWLETETQINFRQMPKSVIQSYNKNFEDFNVQDAYQIETPNGTTYEIEAVRGSQGYEAVFSAKGELLKKEAATSGAE